MVRWVVLGLLLAGAAASTGCKGERERAAPAARALRATDDSGRDVEVAAPARRVISLIPAVTDLVLAMGGVDRLIARTQYDTDVRLDRLPSTGNALMPSLEWITSLQPQLVIAWRDQPSRSVVERISALGIPVYAARTESIADALRATRKVGTLIGLSSAADSLARAIEAELTRVRTAVQDAPRVRVAYILSIDPPMIAGPATFIGELLQIAGGENVFGDVQALWPQVNIEELIRRAPDALVIAHDPGGPPPLERLREMPGWRELPAVRSGRVLIAKPDLYNRPGATIPLAARALGRFLHPDSGL
jgi:iron complex transport system substrate-binding protein